MIIRASSTKIERDNQKDDFMFYDSEEFCHTGVLRRISNMMECGMDEQISIKEAAGILGVTTKTIQRYITKGLFTKVKKGARTYLILSEVRNILEKSPPGKPITHPGGTPSTRHVSDIVTLHRERYESLLIELGELRKQSQFVNEYKEALLKMENELREKDNEINSLRSEIANMILACRDKDTEYSENLTKIRKLEAELEHFKNVKQWWQR